MTYDEIMKQLEEMGTEQTKNTFIRHGAPEPLYGVKVGDMKKLVKYGKKDQELARALYESGNSDAMYLAGLTVNPKQMDKALLQQWIENSKWHTHAEYTVARVAAESPYGHELAMEWIRSENELTATCGWSTYANYISITPDEQLDRGEISGLLQIVAETIHQERNWVRYTMNGFVIMAGTAVTGMLEEAMQVAEQIGKVHVDVGKTACKVPLATAYIHKVEAAGRLGVKRKTCIC